MKEDIKEIFKHLLFFLFPIIFFGILVVIFEKYFLININDLVEDTKYKAIEIVIILISSIFYLLGLLGVLMIPSLLFHIMKFIYITWKKQAVDRYCFVHGLVIIFVNNSKLFLVSRAETGFIKETIDNLYFFIATSELDNKKELIINFSDSSINIKEAIGSNIIGGNVQGDVKNGQ